MTNKNKTIGIIGFGNFGMLMAAVLNEYHDVLVYNHSKDREIGEKAKKTGIKLVDWDKINKCDVVIISTPISITESIIKRVAPNLKKGALLLDTCSVKKYPCEWLKKHTPRDVEIMGTHPMFGPNTTKFEAGKKYWEIKDKQVILCPIRISDNRKNKIKKFLKTLELTVIETTPDDHDFQNAKTLSFVHFLGRSLTEAGIGEQKIYTPGYADVLKILPHTNKDNWQLFYDMNNFNPYAEKVRRQFLDACDKIENKIIRSGADNEFDFNRKMINKLDTRIFSALEERMKVAKKIGVIKKKRKMAIVDSKREKEIVEKRKKSFKLSNEFIEKIYKLIFKESYKNQK